jgi:hypothetical protein
MANRRYARRANLGLRPALARPTVAYTISAPGNGVNLAIAGAAWTVADYLDPTNSR